MSDDTWKVATGKAVDRVGIDPARASARLTSFRQWLLRASCEIRDWLGSLGWKGRTGLAAATIFIVGFGGVFAWLSATLPLEQSLKPLPKPALTFVATDGTEFAQRGAYKDDPVALEEVPQHLIDALLSMEDRHFFVHFGIDPSGIARAAWRNWREGEVVEGGSTLTQQLAKFTFLPLNRTYERKFNEAVLAMWLEARLSKEEILVRYLSSAYFGNGTYGLRAAARRYFDKPVSELTLAESAMLVGLLRAPSKLAPTRDIEAARDRAAVVLDAMVDNGKLAPDEAKAVQPANLAESKADSHIGSYFADWVTGSLPEIEGRYGQVRVETTLDAKLQARAEEIVRDVLAGKGEKRAAGQAALVAMRPDGRVLALVGGKNYKDSQFNRATQAQRQPGSAFKLFVYLAALRDGASLNAAIPDRPIEVNGWKPRNFDGRFHGRVSLLSAFAASRNVPAVILSETHGRDGVIRAARDLGITSKLNDAPSLALGASEVNLLELTSAYASVAAEAYPVTARGVNAVDGLHAPRRADGKPLEHARELKTLLHAVVTSGTGRGARIGVPAFGKTGTSQEYRDGWFVGFAGDLVVGVWVGNDDNSPTKNVSGGNMPVRIWRSFMTSALEADAITVDAEQHEYERPRGRRRGGGGILKKLFRSFGF